MRILRVLFIMVCSTSVLAGCASGTLRRAAGAFGTQTKIAVQMHETVLSNYLAFKIDEAREFYIKNNTVLITTSACDELATAEVNYAKIAPECRIVPKNKIGKRKNEPDLIDPVYADNLRNLAHALGGYAESLAILADDFTAQNAALGRSISAFGAQVIALDNAIAKTQNRSGSIPKKQLTAVAELVGAILNAQLQWSRDQKLIELIRRMDPIVQESAVLLSESTFLARETHKTAIDKALFVALRDQNRAARNSNTPKKQLRKLNNNLYTKFEDLKQVAAIRDPFIAIAKAHTALVKESEKPLSSLGFADYTVFVEHLLTIAEKTQALAVASKE